MHTYFIGTIALLLTVLVAATATAQDASVNSNGEGLVFVASQFDVEETTENITALMEANENITLLGVVDHAAAAASVDLELLPTCVILFGNPNLGTPLMQEKQTTALDLPQKILVWETEDGETFVGFNSPQYVAARHGVMDGTEQLETINNALSSIVASVTDDSDTVQPALMSEGAMEVMELMDKGFINVESANDHATTVENVQAILEERGFRVPFVVDHAISAANNDLDLRPTTLFIFGNPNVGTPFMQLERTIAIDLPQKMLVWEDADGMVLITYNAPAYLFQRAGVADEDVPENVPNVADALAGIAEAAATAAE
ncbi:MAG: DUF302 domain-containing protein [Chloroflexota bacterium]